MPTYKKFIFKDSMDYDGVVSPFWDGGTLHCNEDFIIIGKSKYFSVCAIESCEGGLVAVDGVLVNSYYLIELESFEDNFVPGLHQKTISSSFGNSQMTLAIYSDILQVAVHDGDCLIYSEYKDRIILEPIKGMMVASNVSLDDIISFLEKN